MSEGLVEPPRVLLTAREAAELLRVSTRTLWGLTASGRVPFVRIGRSVRYPHDELVGWIGSFDRYAQGKGADAAHWLSRYNGETLLVDRKSGQPRTIFVPRAAVSMTGGIQPAVLARALGPENRENGLAARMALII